MKRNKEEEDLGRGTRKISRKLKILLITVAVLTPVTIFAGYYFYMNATGPVPRLYMVPMRDGVRLATDVYLPPGEGPFPAILYRTPYGREIGRGYAAFFLQYGVAFISQDHRGCHDSEGEYTAFGADGRDAEDTVKWMEEQPWFNGVFATIGMSAMGITQYRQVTYIDPAAQIIYVATPDLYTQAMYWGGAPRKMLAENWLKSIGHEDYYNKLFPPPGINSDFAREHRLIDADYSNVTWPSVHVGGWFDCFTQGTLDGFMGYQHLGGPGGKGNAHLVMGPWTHAIGDPNPGELHFPEGDKTFYTDIKDKMLAEVLLNTTKYGRHTDYPPVIYYLMGDTSEESPNWNIWVKADDWPVPHSNFSLYFHPNGSLAEIPPTASGSLSFIFDPSNPVKTLGGGNLMSPRGPYDQRPVEENRTDILKFEYTPENPLTVVGRIYVEIFVTSNCTDTDFTAKLMDIYPDGRKIILTDGIIRMRYRNGYEKEELMDGSGTTVYRAVIDLWSTAYVFNKGHKLAVSISSSNYPRFDVNPNTGAPIFPTNTSTPYYLANNTLKMTPIYPSRIILPIPISTPEPWNYTAF